MTDVDTDGNISSSEEGEVVMETMESFIRRGSTTKTVDVVGSDGIDRHEVAQSTPPHSMDGETSVKDELEKITKDISNLRKHLKEIDSNFDNQGKKENLREIADFQIMLKQKDEEIADLKQQVTNFVTTKLKQRQSEDEAKRQMFEQFKRERELRKQTMETKKQEWKDNVNQITTNMKTQYNKIINERSEDYEKEIQRQEILYKGEINQLRQKLKDAREAALYLSQDENFHGILQKPSSIISKEMRTCPKYLNSDEEVTPTMDRPKRTKKKTVVKTPSSGSSSSEQETIDVEVELKIQGKGLEMRIQKLKSFLKYGVNAIIGLEDNEIKELNDKIVNQETQAERLMASKLKLEEIFLKNLTRCTTKTSISMESLIGAADNLLKESDSVTEIVNSQMQERFLKTYSQNTETMKSLIWPQFSGTTLPQIFSFESEMNRLLNKISVPRTDRGNFIKKQIMYPAKQRIDLELGVNPTEREVFDLLKKYYGSTFHISEIIISEHEKAGQVLDATNSDWRSIFQAVTKHNHLIKETLILSNNAQESPITGNYIRTLELSLSSSYQQRLSMEYHNGDSDTKFQDLQKLFKLIEEQATNWKLSESTTAK